MSWRPLNHSRDVALLPVTNLLCHVRACCSLPRPAVVLRAFPPFCVTWPLHTHTHTHLHVCSQSSHQRSPVYTHQSLSHMVSRHTQCIVPSQHSCPLPLIVFLILPVCRAFIFTTARFAFTFPLLSGIKRKHLLRVRGIELHFKTLHVSRNRGHEGRN